jgi:hypothetical protein
VDLFDEGADRLAGVLGIPIGSAVHFLLLECLHEVLRLGIVIRIADAAHAWLDIVCLQPRAAFASGVLHAAIRMMNQVARGRSARPERSPPLFRQDCDRLHAALVGLGAAASKAKNRP